MVSHNPLVSHMKLSQQLDRDLPGPEGLSSHSEKKDSPEMFLLRNWALFENLLLLGVPEPLPKRCWAHEIFLISIFLISGAAGVLTVPWRRVTIMLL